METPTSITDSAQNELQSQLANLTFSTHASQPPFPFTKLPIELQRLILEEVKAELPPSVKHRLAQLSSVSREWNAFFEPFIWHTLNFESSPSPSSLFGFKDIITKSPRWRLIKKVTFHILLTGYDFTYNYNNDRDFPRQLSYLFSLLAQWPKDKGTVTPPPGIALELSAGFPSHERHSISRPPNMGSLSHVPAATLMQPLVGNLLHFLAFNPNQLSQPNRPNLAVVPIVEAFSVTQNSLRSFSASTIETIITSLPRVRHINYEPWRAFTANSQARRDKANLQLFNTVICSIHHSVRRIALWEAYSELQSRNVNFVKTMDPELVHSAVIASFRLRELAISHAADATFFFRQFLERVAQSSNYMQLDGMSVRLPSTCQLKHLALTSNIPSSPGELDRLLILASRAALHMPGLKILEVWGPGVGEGFFFRYHVKHTEVILTVAATWDLKRNKEVLREWERVASMHPLWHLQYRIEQIDEKSLKEPDSICKHLQLSHLLRQW